MPDWYPGEHSDPYYPRSIKVRDLAPSHLTGDRLAFWLKARTKGLALWRPAMKFRAGAGEGYKAGFVTLDVTATQDGTAGQADFGRLPPDSTVEAPGVGWAHVNDTWFEQQFQSNMNKELQRVIAHEVGHCLGFGHNPDPGLMNANHGTNPTDLELDLLRCYWHT